MGQQQHSPGPWMVGPHPKAGACYVGVARDGRYAGDIAELHFQHSRPRDVQEANARLIAAAPDLLAAAKAVLTWEGYDDRPRTTIPQWDALIAAIAKAEGDR